MRVELSFIHACRLDLLLLQIACDRQIKIYLRETFNTFVNEHFKSKNIYDTKVGAAALDKGPVASLTSLGQVFFLRELEGQ